MNALLPKFLEVVTPWAMRHQWAPGQRFHDPDNKVGMYSLWLFLEGEAHVSMGGRTWEVGAGTASLWPSNGQREIFVPRGASWLSIRLNATLWGHLDLLQLLWPPLVWQPDERNGALLRGAMESLIEEWAGATSYPLTSPDNLDFYLAQRFATWETRDSTSFLLCDAYARAIVGLCWRMLSTVDLESATDSHFPDWFAPLVQRLRAQPNIPIEHLAREAGISPTQLRRQFQKWFGASPREYLNRLRLEEARHLLEGSDLTAGEIAGQIGFLSVPHFNRLFKSHFGMPPAQYRGLSRLDGSQRENG